MSTTTAEQLSDIDSRVAPPAPRIEPTNLAHGENTFFLLLADPHEEKIARAYIAAKYPKTKAKIARMLPLPRLSEGMVIIPLFRRSDRTPMERGMIDVHGRPFTQRTSPLDVAHEVREGTPVVVAKHWRKSSIDDAFGAFGGVLNRSSFLDELNVSCSPCTAHAEIGSPDEVLMRF